jgi:hypothetical protein
MTSGNRSDATADSGERLRILLQRAQLTPEQFAHRLNRLSSQMGLTERIDRKTPYKWLRGSAPRKPWPALAASVLSQELNAEIQPDDIGWRTAGGGLMFVPANTGLVVPWSGTGTINAAFEVAETNVMDRRVFLQITGATLTQPAFEWLLARPANDVIGISGKRVTDTHVDSIEEITAQLRRMDDQFGGGSVLDLVKSQVRFVLDLLRSHRYATSVGMRLHGAASELLRLAGWVSFDAGQHAQAQRFWIAALHGAHSAGDKSLGANILGFMSCQAKDLDLHTEAIHLADAARQGYPGASSRVSAILNLRAAQAYAQIDDTANVQGAIDTAYDAFRSNNADTVDPAWSYWLDEAQVNEQAGYCYTKLGNWPLAQNHLSTAIRLQTDLYTREGVLRHALLAVTFANQGEPEHACTIANKAVDALEEDVDSERCVGHIRRVRAALAPYRRVPIVRDFEERTNQLFGTAA